MQRSVRSKPRIFAVASIRITMPQNLLIDLSYLPPLQWFSKVNAREKVTLEACEHYRKGSYRNRCHIAGAQGLLRLSVPLTAGKNAQMPVREVRIAAEQPWQQQHWQSIQSAYGKSPFFEYYADDLRPFYEKKYERLWDWNFALLQCVTELIGADVTYTFSDTYYKVPPPDTLDFRGGVHPNPHKALPDPEFEHVPYEQVFTEKHGFLPNLSILDALFCKGPETILLL